uniref:Uncharacterized protein n=1 Tax=Ciona intestinalis TaxID=7719 RepID=H2XY05_CIOIN
MPRSGVLHWPSVMQSKGKFTNRNRFTRIRVYVNSLVCVPSPGTSPA